MLRIFIIGGGKRGKALLSRLLQFKSIEVVGMADADRSAPGVLLAQEAGVPVYFNDPILALGALHVDLVFDQSGDPELGYRLSHEYDHPDRVVKERVLSLLLGITHELEGREARTQGHLKEHQILFEINLMLSRSQTTTEIFDAIVAGGMQITGMAAGSLSIFKKERKELFLVSAEGFSSEFYRKPVYPVHPGGLSEHILSHQEPVLIPDLAQYPAFNSPTLRKEGIRSLIAVPLMAEREPVGILYNDDFKVWTFTPTMIDILRSLGTQAVIAIQKQQAYEQVKNLSLRDPLTGIYNRRYLNERLMMEVTRAYRLRHPLSIVMIDIDHFKEMNDRFGHLVGDDILRGLTERFNKVLRPYDTFTRFGGEEFLIIMPETDGQEALSVAERLRETTTAARLLPEEGSLTCSFGISTAQGDEDHPLTPEVMIQLADMALYEAKEAGRNRVVAAGKEAGSSHREEERLEK